MTNHWALHGHWTLWNAWQLNTEFHAVVERLKRSTTFKHNKTKDQVASLVTTPFLRLVTTYWSLILVCESWTLNGGRFGTSDVLKAFCTPIHKVTFWNVKCCGTSDVRLVQVGYKLCIHGCWWRFRFRLQSWALYAEAFSRGWIFVIFTPSEIGRAIFSVGKAVLKMDTSWRMQNMQLLRDDYQFQIVSEAIFLIIYS